MDFESILNVVRAATQYPLVVFFGGYVALALGLCMLVALVLEGVFSYFGWSDPNAYEQSLDLLDLEAVQANSRRAKGLILDMDAYHEGRVVYDTPQEINARHKGFAIGNRRRA